MTALYKEDVLIYRRLTDARWRAFRKMGEGWGIGVTVYLTNRGSYMTEVDIGFDNSIMVVASSRFDTITKAKLWGEQIVRGFIRKLDYWVEE